MAYLYDDVNLTNYTPVFNTGAISDPAGTEIDYLYWRDLWNAQREQSNYNAKTLYEILARMNEGIWHAVNGAVAIRKVPINDGVASSSDNVSAQIDFLAERMLRTMPLLHKDTGASALKHTGFAVPELTDVAAQLDYLYTVQQALEASSTSTHNNMAFRDAADCHPVSAITGLEGRLQDIIAGNIKDYPHNLFPGRAAIGAHPIAAITGLTDLLNQILGILDTHKHTSTQVTALNAAGTSAALQVILDNLYALLQAATGITELVHNAMTGRTLADCHSIGAITGLQAALDDRYTKAEVDAMFQTKIVMYEGETLPAGLPEGTICLRRD